MMTSNLSSGSSNSHNNMLCGADVKSRIPVPKSTSRIPLRLPSSGKISSTRSSLIERNPSSGKISSTRSSLIARNPATKMNVIKPIITKRSKPPFKEFNLTKAGTKAVVKRKSFGTYKGIKAPSDFKQQKIPENFSMQRKEKERKMKNISQPQKENASPNLATAKMDENSNILLKKDEESYQDIQSENDFNFVPSEYYRNQILANKEVTPRQLRHLSLAEDNPEKMAIERLQRWSLSKPAKLSISSKKETNFRSSIFKMDMKSKSSLIKNEEKLSQHCSWASESPSKPPQNGPNPYEVAMAQIKRMSIKRTGSPFGARLKLEACSPIISPNKPLDPYAIAKQQVQEWRKAKEERRKAIGLSPKLSKRQESTLPASSPKAATLKVSDVFSRSSSVYRPFQCLLESSASKQHVLKQRLTDISEHSEGEHTNPLSHYSSDNSSRTSCSAIGEESHPACAPTPEPPAFTPLCSISSSLLSATQQNNCGGLKQTPMAAQLFPNTIQLHTPRAAYSSTITVSPMFLFGRGQTTAVDSHCAPICTPLVLQNIARVNEEEKILSPVRQKLDFSETIHEDTIKTSGDETKFELRYSNFTKHIPTKRKMEELRADEECCRIMVNQESPLSQCRNTLLNPVAVILSKGDRMHFVPIGKEGGYQDIRNCSSKI